MIRNIILADKKKPKQEIKDSRNLFLRCAYFDDKITCEEVPN